MAKATDPNEHRTELWRAVKKARPTLTDEEVDQLLAETAEKERRMIVVEKMNPDQARELIREELFAGVDPAAEEHVS